MILNNNAIEIEKALELESGSLRHVQNFIFYARKGTQTLEIHTTPASDDYSKIEVLEVRGL